MTDTAQSRAPYRNPTPARGGDDVELALAGGVYALHLVSLFVFLAPAILGVAIAYARRGEADEVSRSHYTFQIRTFWMVAWLTLLSLLLLAGAATTTVTEVVHAVTGSDGWDAWDAVRLDGRDFRITPLTVMLAIASGLTAIAAFLWLLATSIYGAARLASGRAIGDSRGR